MKKRIYISENIYIDVVSKTRRNLLVEKAQKDFGFNDIEKRILFGQYTGNNLYLKNQEYKIITPFSNEWPNKRYIKYLFAPYKNCSFDIKNKGRLFSFKIKNFYVDNYFIYAKLTMNPKDSKQFIEELFKYYGYKDAICKFRKAGEKSIVAFTKYYSSLEYEKILRTKEIISKLICEKILLDKNQLLEPLIQDCQVSQYLEYKPPQNAETIDIGEVVDIKEINILEDIFCQLNRCYQKGNHFFIDALADKENIYISPRLITAVFYNYIHSTYPNLWPFVISKDTALDIFIFKYRSYINKKLVNIDKFRYNKFRVMLYDNNDQEITSFTTLYLPLKRDNFILEISPYIEEQYIANIKRFDK